MRIVVWGINYAPEKIGIGPCNTALCEFLAQNTDCEVTMLTSFPYYPFGSPNGKGSRSRAETREGVKIIRCWMYVPRQLGLLKRVMHELSFIISSAIQFLMLKKPDLVIVISPPFLLGVAARLLGWLRRFRYVIHIQDLQPDAAIRLGMLKRRVFIRLAMGLAEFGERGAWRISGISQGMLDSLEKRGISSKKLICFPNGIRVRPYGRGNRFRKLYGFGEHDFVFVYSGNIGVKQGLIRLVEAARHIQNQSVRLVICGEGPDRIHLTKAASDCPNVSMIPLLDESTYLEMVADSDLMVVSLVPGTGAAFLPSKLLSACAAGRPVLGLCDDLSELARVIRQSNCGFVCSSESPEQIAETIDAIAGQESALAQMGESGLRFAEQYSWDLMIRRYAQEMEIKVRDR